MADFDILTLEPSTIKRGMAGKYTLLYGPPKCGKTSFAVQTPKTLVCAFELGLNALAGVRYVPMLKWQDFKKVINQLRKPQAQEMYSTIVIDTVSIAVSLCEKYVCQQNDVERINEIPFGQGWNLHKREMQECFREITMMGYGLVLLAHAKENVSDNGVLSARPDIPAAAVNTINGIVDIIGYIHSEEDENGEVEQKLILRGNNNILAGSRYKYIAPVIPFSYESLCGAIDDAIDTAESNGAQVDESSLTDLLQDMNKEEEKLDFNSVMQEARTLWEGYLNNSASIPDKNARLEKLQEIVKSVFGRVIKLSQVSPSQVDFLQEVVVKIKAL